MVDVPTTTQTTPTVTSTGVPTVTSTDGVIPDDWTPGLVPAGEEWNFRAEDFRGPAKDWTAPLNPYGTSPQGYQTAEQFANMQDFQKALAAQPMGTSQLLTTTPKDALTAMPGVGYAGQDIDFAGMPAEDVLAARQLAAQGGGRDPDEDARLNAALYAQRPVMPDDFGSGNPFADRQLAARLAPNYLTSPAVASNVVNMGLGQRANFENPAARNFLRTPQAVGDAEIVNPQLRDTLMFLGEFDASPAGRQLQRQRGINVQANEFASAQRAQQQRARNAQADALRQALGFGTSGAVPLPSTIQAGKAAAVAARTAEVEKQRAAAARPKKPPPSKGGGKQSKADIARAAVTAAKRDAKKKAAERAVPPQIAKPKPTRVAPSKAAQVKKAAAVKKQKAYVAALPPAKKAARAKNIREEEKKAKRAAEAKKKGYAIGPDMRRR